MGSITNRERLEIMKEVRCRQARTDFLTFRKLINPKAKWGWWQIEVAGKLQEFYNDLYAGKRPKLVIEAPPQHGKSYQIIDFIAWCAGRDPDKRTIYASFSDRLGVRANLRLQRIINSEIYRRIFPDTSVGSGLQNQSVLEYDGRDGSFRNTTVRGSITGEGLDLGIVDDPIKGRAEARSQTVREATWDWFTDDFFSRFADDAGLLIILTRWHLDDPVGRLVAHDPTVQVLKYPAIAEKDEPHRKAGEALFPEHKSLEFLLERKRIMASGNWLALYQQRPIAEAGDVFEPDRIDIVDAIPPGLGRIVRGWDFASSDSSKADYTAGGKLGRLADARFIILHMVRGRERTNKRDALIKATAAADGYGTKQNFPQDPGSAGESQVYYMAQQLAGARIESSTESGDKVLRAEGFASQVNAGNVIMLRGEYNTALLDELRFFPDGVNDDQVDALSRAFNALFKGVSIYEV